MPGSPLGVTCPLSPVPWNLQPGPPHSTPMLLALAALALAPADSAAFVRVNQVGYLPDAPKVAVVCALAARAGRQLHRRRRARARGPRAASRARRTAAFGPCAATYRLDFSGAAARGLRTASRRGARLAARERGARGLRGRRRHAAALHAAAALRLQPALPRLRARAHRRHPGGPPTRAGEFIPVAGGWADAADYLQYVTTSATATLRCCCLPRPPGRLRRRASRADGPPGRERGARRARRGAARPGVAGADVPARTALMLNQLGDDRDHAFYDLPPTDSSDYGWGKGGCRPGVSRAPADRRGSSATRTAPTATPPPPASTPPRWRSGAQLLRASATPRFAALLARKAPRRLRAGAPLSRRLPDGPGHRAVLLRGGQLGGRHGAGRGRAPCPHRRGRATWREAVAYAAREPVTPWMGADTARHYQWYPWHNNGHYEIWRQGDAGQRERMVEYYREGLERVAARADNGFRMGVPFIWCSNNLVAMLRHAGVPLPADERRRELPRATSRRRWTGSSAPTPGASP